MAEEQPPGHDHRVPVDDETKRALRDVAESLSQIFPGMGFALMVFDWEQAPDGTEKRMLWVSNAQRADMLRAMSEFIQKQGS